MKIYSIKIFLLLVFAGAFTLVTVSCDPEEIPDSVKVTPSVKDIKFSGDGKTATADGQAIIPEFSVETNRNGWTVELSEKDSWLKVSKGEKGFKLTADPNESYDARGQITVTVRAGKAVSDVIKVTQSGATLPDNNLYFFGMYEVSGPDVYAYFKDGEFKEIGRDDEMYIASIDVWNGDLYLGGALLNGTGVSPAYWKNGVKVSLPHNGNLAAVYDITVSGGDVYAVGMDLDQATRSEDCICWKNGEKLFIFSNDAEHEYSIAHIAVYEGDVYLAGREHRLVDGKPVTAVAYWKNGEIFRIKEGDDRSIFEVSDIAVSDGGVYVGGLFFDGNDYSRGYWHNGRFEKLKDGSVTNIVGMEVSGGDVYMAGNTVDPYGNSVGALWKNGNQSYLYPRDIEIGTATQVFDIAVCNGTVYLSGYEQVRGEEGSSGVMITGYWIDGLVFVPFTGPGADFVPLLMAAEAK